MLLFVYVFKTFKLKDHLTELFYNADFKVHVTINVSLQLYTQVMVTKLSFCPGFRVTGIGGP
jgi:hypothetical protein